MYSNLTKEEQIAFAKNRAYWRKRGRRAEQRLTNASIAETDAQLALYYQRSRDSVVSEFEATLEHLLARAQDGKVTPADLYKLEKYWKMQASLAHELQKLGDRQVSLFARQFTKHYQAVYALAEPSAKAFATIDKAAARKMIETVWAADNKLWSQRVWLNTAKLQQELNDELIKCVATGKKSTDLKEALQERFDVSYHRANTLVHTETAHIQTQAAQHRYKDAGVQEVEFWADPDERTCEICGKLHKKKFSIHSQMPIPAHPNCRCCIIPVV